MCCISVNAFILLDSGATDPSIIGSANMNDISDVDVYFKRLYAKTTNPPPITVDEFLDIMTRCKDSSIPREKVRASRTPRATDVVLSLFAGSVSEWHQESLRGVQVLLAVSRTRITSHCTTVRWTIRTRPISKSCRYTGLSSHCRRIEKADGL